MRNPILTQIDREAIYSYTCPIFKENHIDISGTRQLGACCRGDRQRLNKGDLIIVMNVVT